MRIAFVLPGYPWGPIGGFRVVYEYANRLVAKGHEVAIVHPRHLGNVSPPPAGSLYRRLRREGAKLRDWAFRPSVHWQPVDGRVRMLYVSDPDASKVPDGDVVFATTWHTAEYVLGYPKSKGLRFYLIQAYETWWGPKDRVEAAWRAPLYKVVIARWLFEIGRELGCEHMEYIPNGIDHEKYRLLNPISNRPKRVATLFHADDWKGSPDGLRALGVVKNQHPDVRVTLFGTPRRTESIPEWVEYLRDPPQTEIVNRIYNGSSIYLCASWSEGFPLPPAEAMACGCALVSTDIGGVREYAEHGVTALLSPPRDPEALARNLIRVLDDDALRVRLAEAGNRGIRQFTWERSTDQLERFIQGQVSARSGG